MIILGILDTTKGIISGQTQSDWVPFFAGAIGAMGVRIIFRAIQYYIVNRRTRAKYFCFEDAEGTMRHSVGEAVNDQDAEEHNAWLHTLNHINEGFHTLYGPYNNDFGRPGYYKVIFRIKGTGFTSMGASKPAVRLEVVESKTEFLSVPGNVNLTLGSIVSSNVHVSPVFGAGRETDESDLRGISGASGNPVSGIAGTSGKLRQ
jgi:hypothetical protein